MKDKITYLDNNATTPVDARVIAEVTAQFEEIYANASSPYFFGLNTKKSIEKYRKNIGRILGADPQEIYFNSGSTEGINFALKGLALHEDNSKKHIITSCAEHKAVLETCHYLEKIGFMVEYLPVDNSGRINLGQLKEALRNDTLLICLMWVNNETGVINPIDEIGALAREAGVYFICDGTQGAGKLSINVQASNIDVFCFSAHKFHGTKGIGGMHINHSIVNKNKILPLLHGGGQEDGLRSGTYNTPLIAGLDLALRIADEEADRNKKHISQLRDLLENELLKIKGSYINGVNAPRIHNTTNIFIPNFDIEIFLGINKDIAISNGSACNSAVIEASHVLLAMGVKDEDAMNSIRISIGKDNTKEEINLLVERIKNFVINF